jgi:hypothetical protein
MEPKFAVHTEVHHRRRNLVGFIESSRWDGYDKTTYYKVRVPGVGSPIWDEQYLTPTGTLKNSKVKNLLEADY